MYHFLIITEAVKTICLIWQQRKNQIQSFQAKPTSWQKSNQTEQPSEFELLGCFGGPPHPSFFLLFKWVSYYEVRLADLEDKTFLLVLKQKCNDPLSPFWLLDKAEAGARTLFKVLAARRWSVYVSCPRTGKGCTLGTVCEGEIRPEISVLSALSAFPATFQSRQHHDWQ